MARTERRGHYDRSKPTEARQAERRELILDAATEVFATRTLANTRVDDIVAYAKISRRTLYEQFASVDAILEEVYDRAVRTSFATVFELVAGVADPVERIEVGVRAYFEIIAVNPSAARVVFEEYRYAGSAQAARYELNSARYATLMLEFLNAAHAAGRLGRRPDELTVYALTKACEAVGVRALHRGEHAKLGDVAPIMSRLLIDAFSVATP